MLEALMFPQTIVRYQGPVGHKLDKSEIDQSPCKQHQDRTKQNTQLQNGEVKKERIRKYSKHSIITEFNITGPGGGYPEDFRWASGTRGLANRSTQEIQSPHQSSPNNPTAE